MKCLVQLTLACVLFSKANTLRCYDCSDEPCYATEKSCTSPYDRCGRANYFVNQDGKFHKVAHSMACMEPSLCFSSSVNFGFRRIVYHPECCDSDLCNGEDHNVSVDHSLNGLKCFSCLDNVCTHTVDCRGNEDFCMSATEIYFKKSQRIKGCVSENLCPSRDVRIDMGPLFSISIKCCKGELCNSGQSNSGQSTSSRRAGQCLAPALMTFLTSITLLH